MNAEASRGGGGAAATPPPWWVRAVRFGLVGGGGVLVDTLVLHLLAGAGWPVPLAKVVAVETALLNNFLWNERWTFRDRREAAGRGRGVGRRLLRFHVICLLGMLVGVGALHDLHAGLGWNLYMANLVAIVAAAGWNFTLSLRYGWRAGAGGVGPALRAGRRAGRGRLVGVRRSGVAARTTHGDEGVAATTLR